MKGGVVLQDTVCARECKNGRRQRRRVSARKRVWASAPQAEGADVMNERLGLRDTESKAAV